MYYYIFELFHYSPLLLLFISGELLAEDSLSSGFGNSKEMVTSVVEALQRKPNPQNILTNSIEAAQEVGHCDYESQTSWGKTVRRF